MRIFIAMFFLVGVFTSDDLRAIVAYLCVSTIMILWKALDGIQEAIKERNV